MPDDELEITLYDRASADIDITVRTNPVYRWEAKGDMAFVIIKFIDLLALKIHSLHN